MRVTIGQYIPGNSGLHKLDPRTKMIALVIIMYTLFSVSTWSGYIFITGFILLGIIISRVPIKEILRGLRGIIWFVILTSLLNMFFAQGTELVFKLGFLTIYKEGIILSLQMTLRIVLLVVISSLLTLTTPPIQLADGLEFFMKPLTKVGVPSHEIAMMMTIALRFIPTLLEELDRIKKAQVARGADLETGGFIDRIKKMIPLLVPLFVSSFQKAEDLALAMDSRCYNGGIGRTRLHELRFKNYDYIAGIVFIVYLLVYIFFFK